MTRAAVASVVALMLGFLAGRWTSPAPPAAVVAVPAVADAAPAAAALPVTLPDCQQQLALALGVLQAAEIERAGTPVPFPADLPEDMRPENFERAVRETIEDCPGVEVRVAHVDCEEFPCMAFFSQPTGGMNHAVEALRRCETWTERFGKNSGQLNHSFMTDAGVREYSAVTPRPADSDFDENAGKRSHIRLEQGREELMAAWGGRDFTELETLDSQIAFWRENGGEDMADHLTALEKKRAKLVEEGE